MVPFMEFFAGGDDEARAAWSEDAHEIIPPTGSLARAEYLDALETVLKHETDPDLRRAARERYLALTEGTPT